jgi:hypothetical protein
LLKGGVVAGIAAPKSAMQQRCSGKSLVRIPASRQALRGVFGAAIEIAAVRAAGADFAWPHAAVNATMRRCRKFGRASRGLDLANKNRGGFNECAGRSQQILARQVRHVTAMSSPEELTLVIGRWLRPIVAVLHVVRRLTFQPISSREQRSTAPNQ